VAGCVSIREDFDKYGFIMPVMPENWRHYIETSTIYKQTVDRDEPGILERISTEGRRWILEHYTPVPATLRFLETIGTRVHAYCAQRS